MNIQLTVKGVNKGFCMEFILRTLIRLNRYCGTQNKRNKWAAATVIHSIKLQKSDNFQILPQKMCEKDYLNFLNIIFCGKKEFRFYHNELKDDEDGTIEGIFWETPLEQLSI